jgi:NAD(P)-dependent dehydrogenase (short-subunit alcohol dehydrogenase family)
VTSALFDLSGKVALVTGSSVGIGRMIAQGLADAGAKVYVVSRTAADCDRAAAEIVAGGGQAVALAADLSDVAEIRRLATEVESREGKLDILVNNAGQMVQAAFGEWTPEQWDTIANLQMRTPFFMVQEFAPLLEKAGSMDDPSRVINIGSIDGIKPPFLDTFPYPAAKAGVHAMTRQLAKVLAPRGVAVNAIAPGAFPSRTADPILAEHLQDFIDVTPLARIGRPDDMAGTVVWMCGRGGSFLCGSLIVLDGGIVA